jgi:hypothetical protein
LDLTQGPFEGGMGLATIESYVRTLIGLEVDGMMVVE